MKKLKHNGNKKIIAVIISIFIILNILINQTIYADTGICDIVATSSTTNLDKSQEFNVKLKLENIAITEGIYRVQFDVEASPNILEELKQADIKAADGWTVQLSTTKKITLMYRNKAKTNMDLVTLNFKTKSNIESSDITGGDKNNLNLKFTNIRINTTAKLNDVTLKYNLAGSGHTATTTNTNNIAPTITTTPGVVNTVTTPEKNPKAGLDYSYIIAISILAIIAIISFIGIRKTTGKI